MSPQVRRMSHDAAVTILVVGALDDIVIAMMITIVTMMMLVTMSTCLYLICFF